MKKTEKFSGRQYGMICHINYDMLPISRKEAKCSCIRNIDAQVIPVSKDIGCQFPGLAN